MIFRRPTHGITVRWSRFLRRFVHVGTRRARQAGYIVSRGVVASHVVSSHEVSNHVVSDHVVSSHVVSSHVVSSHVVSSHVVSSHVSSSLCSAGRATTIHFAPTFAAIRAIDTPNSHQPPLPFRSLILHLAPIICCPTESISSCFRGPSRWAALRTCSEWSLRLEVGDWVRDWRRDPVLDLRRLGTYEPEDAHACDANACTRLPTRRR
jgi:hypothetical protein